MKCQQTGGSLTRKVIATTASLTLAISMTPCAAFAQTLSTTDSSVAGASEIASDTVNELSLQSGGNSFPDAEKGSWYYDSVTRAANLGLISGYDNGTFGPFNALTRAQAATILWRYYEPTAAANYKASSAKNTTGMADVQSAQYYTGAANWAVSAGVISGKDQANGSKLFDPDGAITREQLCAIVANASAKFAGSKVTGADRTRFSFMPDKGSTDAWATDSVAWGLNSGVISGKETGGQRLIDPLGQVTRAEMAAVLMNSIDNSLLKVSQGSTVECFSKAAGDYNHSSGLGSWATALHLNQDGSFTGVFHDTDMGLTSANIYYSEFKGKYSNPVRIDDYTYRVTVQSFEITTPAGTTATDTANHAVWHYVDSAAGMPKVGETVLFYFPGKSTSEMTSNCWSWIDDWSNAKKRPAKSDRYIIYSETEKRAFSSK